MKKSQLLSLMWMVLLAVGLTSCASVSTMQTAGVVPEGEVRWAIASTGTGGEGDTKPSADPNFEASVRYGVAENVDIGLKLNFLGGLFDAKYQFMRGDFDLSLDVGVGYQWVRTSGTDNPSSHVLQFHLPLLMEYHFNPYVGLAFGPKLLGIWTVKTDDREDIWNNSGLYVGLMFGLPLRLTEGVWFQPEFNIYTNAYSKAHKSSSEPAADPTADPTAAPTAATTATDSKSRNYFSTVIWQAGVSVFFGGL